MKSELSIMSESFISITQKVKLNDCKIDRSVRSVDGKIFEAFVTLIILSRLSAELVFYIRNNTEMIHIEVNAELNLLTKSQKSH